MGKGFEINERGMRQMERALQDRFNRMDIRVPIKADVPPLGSGNVFITAGDNAQVVMGDNNGTMAQGSIVPVAAGYEALALAVQEFSEKVQALDGLTPEDAEVLRISETGVLEELRKPEPNRKVLAGLLATLKGAAFAVLTGMGEGAGGQLLELAGDLQIPGLG